MCHAILACNLGEVAVSCQVTIKSPVEQFENVVGLIVVMPVFLETIQLWCTKVSTILLQFRANQGDDSPTP